MVSPGSPGVKSSGLSLRSSLTPQRPLNCGAATSGMNCRRKAGTRGGGGGSLRVLLSQALCAFLRGSRPVAWDSQAKASRTVFISVGISLLSAFFACPLHEDTWQGLVLALCPLLFPFHPPAKPSLLPYLLLSPLLWIELLISFSPPQALAPHLTAAWSEEEIQNPGFWLQLVYNMLCNLGQG